MFVLATCGQAPTPGALMGAQQEAAERETTASRSRRLLTTSGLNLLKAESVLAEKTFRRLKAKYTGGWLRSGQRVKLKVRAWSGADDVAPTPPGLPVAEGWSQGHDFKM